MLIPLHHRYIYRSIHTSIHQFQQYTNTRNHNNYHHNQHNNIQNIDLVSSDAYYIYDTPVVPQPDSHTTTTHTHTLKNQLRDWSIYKLPELPKLYRTNTIPIVGGRKSWLKLLQPAKQRTQSNQPHINLKDTRLHQLFHKTQHCIVMFQQLCSNSHTVKYDKVVALYKKYIELINTHKIKLHGICPISRHMIHCCVQHNDLTTANLILTNIEKYVAQLQSHNIVQVYEAYISGIANANKYKTAINIIQRMNEHHMYNMNVYIPLIDNAIKSNDTSIVLGILDRLSVHDKLKLSTSILNKLLDAVIQCERNKDELFDNSLLNNDASTNTQYDNRRLDESIDLILSVFVQHKVNPNGDTFKYVLLSSYCNTKQRIQYITSLVKQYKLQYNPVIAESTVSAYLRLDQLELAISYLQSLQPPTSSHPLKNGYIDRSYTINRTLAMIDDPIQQISTIKQLREEKYMKRHGVDSVPHIGSIPYNFILHYCGIHNKLQHAMYIWTLMYIQRYTPSTRAMCHIIRSAGRCNSHQLIWQIFHTKLNLIHNGVYSSTMWKSLIYGTVRCEDVQHISKAIQLMHQHAHPKHNNQYLAQSAPSVQVWCYLTQMLIVHQQYTVLFNTLHSINAMNDDILCSMMLSIPDLHTANMIISSTLHLLYTRQYGISDQLLQSINSMYTRCAVKSGLVLDADNEFTQAGYRAFCTQFNIHDQLLQQYNHSASAIRHSIVHQLVDQFNTMIQHDNTIDYAIQQLNHTNSSQHEE